jgi:hypothetical protein
MSLNTLMAFTSLFLPLLSPLCSLEGIPVSVHFPELGAAQRGGFSITEHRAYHLVGDLLLAQHNVVSAIPAQVLDLRV